LRHPLLMGKRMLHFKTRYLVTAFLVILSFPALGPAADTAKAKRTEGAQFRDCAACHGARAVLPPGHVSLTGDQNTDCDSCHGKEKNSLRGKIPLGHVHLAGEVTCMDCHDKKPFAFVATDRCRECHGEPREVAALTRSDEAFNPHESPHYGNDMECDMCHHLHVRSENVCGDCHDLEAPTP